MHYVFPILIICVVFYLLIHSKKNKAMVFSQELKDADFKILEINGETTKDLEVKLKSCIDIDEKKILESALEGQGDPKNLSDLMTSSQAFSKTLKLVLGRAFGLSKSRDYLLGNPDLADLPGTYKDLDALINSLASLMVAVNNTQGSYIFY